MFDPLLFVTATGAVGIAALSLRLLQLLAPRVRGTPLWMPVLTLFLASWALNTLVAIVAVFAEFGDDDFAGQLARGVSVCALFGEAALVHLLLGVPRRIRWRPAYAFVVGLYVVAFAFAVLAPSGLFLQAIARYGDFPYAVRTGAFWLIEGAMLFGILGGLAWQLRLWRTGSGPERDAARSLFFAAFIPVSIYLAAPAAGVSIESGQTIAVVVGVFVVGAYLALRSGHLPLPIPATLQGVLNATTSPSLVVDAGALVAMCNRAAKAAFAFEGVPEGAPFELVLRGGFALEGALAATAAHIGDVLVGKVPRFEGPIGEAGEPRRPYRLVVDPLFTERGSSRPGAAVVQFIDETQAREAERSAERLRQLQDLVIRVMGHDLKAPIAVMQGNLELAKMDLGTAGMKEAERAAVAQRLDKAGQAAAGMQVILANARAISRLEMAPGAAPKAEVLDLAKIVRETADLLKPLAEAKAQTLVVSAPGEMRLPMPPGLESVVSNLLSNAIKYTPERGQVDVGLVRAGDRAVFTVADNGPGIPREKRALLFRKFERLAAEQSAGSHGLGLSIAASIVDLAGGSIGAHDRPDGARGTMFRVELPIATAAPAA